MISLGHVLSLTSGQERPVASDVQPHVIDMVAIVGEGGPQFTFQKGMISAKKQQNLIVTTRSPQEEMNTLMTKHMNMFEERGFPNKDCRLEVLGQ